MTGIWAGVKSARNAAGLTMLAAEARRDLERLNFPAANWVPQRTQPDGKPVLDVLIIGAGMCGQTAAFALMRDGICNFRIVDRAAKGLEGPWATYARMQILRSPKHLTGPDLGVASLTFRAWYEAQHGADGWQRLHKIGRLDWRDYLIWVRETVGVPVENGVEVTALDPSADGVAVTLRTPAGTEQVSARKIVLAGGRDGAGSVRLPAFPGLASRAGDPEKRRQARCFHSADDIDFAALSGRRIAVLGAGASAFDCAATALEAGAGQVLLYVRGPHLPQVNKSKAASFPGYLKSFPALDDEARWRIITYIFDAKVPPPFESVLRCEVHPGFAIRFGEPWLDVLPDAAGVTVRTRQGDAHSGDARFDAVIFGTGFDVDLSLRPELAAFNCNILLWRDRLDQAKAAESPECARYPYLGPGFEFIERSQGVTPGLGHIHAFNWGVTLSHGAVAGDIPGLRIAVDRLSEAICRALFTADLAKHWQRLQAADEPELEPTPYFVPRDDR